jgi:hypothetical protein
MGHLRLCSDTTAPRAPSGERRLQACRRSRRHQRTTPRCRRRLARRWARSRRMDPVDGRLETAPTRGTAPTRVGRLLVSPAVRRRSAVRPADVHARTDNSDVHVEPHHHHHQFQAALPARWGLPWRPSSRPGSCSPLRGGNGLEDLKGHAVTPRAYGPAFMITSPSPHPMAHQTCTPNASQPQSASHAERHIRTCQAVAVTAHDQRHHGEVVMRLRSTLAAERWEYRSLRYVVFSASATSITRTTVRWPSGDDGRPGPALVPGNQEV